MTRSLRTPALLARHALANTGASILVAALVLLVTFVVAVAPRALTLLSTAELQHGLDSLAVPVRDIDNDGTLTYTAGPGATTLPTAIAGTYGLMDEALARVRASMPRALRSAIGPADYFGRAGDSTPAPSDVGSENGIIFLARFAADPHIASRVRMTAGVAPATAAASGPIPVMMSDDSAAELHWRVGEARTMAQQRVVLSGTFRPLQATAPYWQHATSVLIPQIFDDGNAPRTVTATVYIAPATATTAVDIGDMLLTVWYPVDVARIDITNTSTLLPQLRKFVGTVHALPGRSLEQPFSLTTGTIDAIETALDRTAVTSAVLSMAASGPLGVVLAVFALGARSVVERRRPALALASARGASGWQLRGAMALEGLVLGVIPGAAAIVAAVALVRTDTGASGLAPAIIIALAPAVLFAFAGSPSGLRTARTDLDPRSSGRVRWIVELLVIALAAGALVLLVRRGIASSGTVDPLLAATPLLLSLAVCVGVLRLYPLPLYAIERRLRRGRGLVGFVGAARAVRDPAVGVAATLAIVVAVSVAVFSVTLHSTIATAVSASARTAVGGGDLIARAIFLSDDQRRTIADVPGITRAAGIDNQGDVSLRDGNSSTIVDLLDTQTTPLSAIRSDIPSNLDRKVRGRIPVIVSADLATTANAAKNLELQGAPVTVVGVLPTVSGLNSDHRWVMVDTAFARPLVDLAFAPQLLVMTQHGDPQKTADAVAGSVTGLTVTTYQQALAQTQDSPTVAGLGIALEAAILAVALLAALAVVLTSVINAPGRSRAIGSLRTLGLSSRQTAALVLWELAPVVVTALVAGTLLGLALPFVVTSTIDLSAFTGGTPVTGPHLDPLLIVAVLGIVVLATVVAAAVAIVLSLRRTPASTVKIGAG